MAPAESSVVASEARIQNVRAVLGLYFQRFLALNVRIGTIFMNYLFILQLGGCLGGFPRLRISVEYRCYQKLEQYRTSLIVQSNHFGGVGVGGGGMG